MMDRREFLRRAGGVIVGGVCAGTGGDARAAERPRVAVFSEKGFPYYGVTEMPAPEAIVARLAKLGVDASALTADDLADPARLNPAAFDALVLPYGNTYPRIALENVIAFQRAGGSLVTTGIPFTHPAVREAGGAQGWSANPGWGEYVGLAAEGRSGRSALRLAARSEDWAGCGSERFPVVPGSRVVLSAWMKEVGGTESGGDHLMLRLFDAAGKFLGQPGVQLGRTTGGWQQLTASIAIPDNATQADVSPQMFSRQRTILIDDIFVGVKGSANLVPNGGFEKAMPPRWRDLGDDTRALRPGPGSIGLPYFLTPSGGEPPVAVSAEDPLGLAALPIDWSTLKNAQWMDPRGVPPEGALVPVLGDARRPYAAVIVRDRGAKPTVADVWAYQGPPGERSALAAGQIVIRGVTAVLARRGKLTLAQQRAAFDAMDRLAGTGMAPAVPKPAPRTGAKRTGRK